MGNYQELGKQNWLIIALFIFISFSELKVLPLKGLEWLSFVICALIICFSNSFVLSTKNESFSKISKKFLLFRISWSFSFSLYIILIKSKIFPDLGILLILFFYFLGFLDILFNIFNKEITLEVGPGFMPKNII